MGNLSIAHSFSMPNTIQTTFQHLVAANNLLNDDPLPPPSLHPAPVFAASSHPTSRTEDQEIRILQGTTFSSLNLRHAGFRYSKDGKPLVDGIQFSTVFGHFSVTILNFLAAVRLEQASTEGKMFSYRRGMQRPQRKEAYLEKDVETNKLSSPTTVMKTTYFTTSIFWLNCEPLGQ